MCVLSLQLSPLPSGDHTLAAALAGSKAALAESRADAVVLQSDLRAADLTAASLRQQLKEAEVRRPQFGDGWRHNSVSAHAKEIWLPRLKRRCRTDARQTSVCCSWQCHACPSGRRFSVFCLTFYLTCKLPSQQLQLPQTLYRCMYAGGAHQDTCQGDGVRPGGRDLCCGAAAAAGSSRSAAGGGTAAAGCDGSAAGCDGGVLPVRCRQSPCSASGGRGERAATNLASASGKSEGALISATHGETTIITTGNISCAV